MSITHIVLLKYTYTYVLCVGLPTSNPVAFLFLCSLRDPPASQPREFLAETAFKKVAAAMPPPSPLRPGQKAFPRAPEPRARPLHSTRINDCGSPWKPLLLLACLPACLPSFNFLATPASSSSSYPSSSQCLRCPSAVLVVLLPRAHSAYTNQERAEQFWSFPLVCCCWIAACLICWTLSICMLIVDCCIHRIPVFVSVSFLAILFINAAKVKFIIAS